MEPKTIDSIIAELRKQLDYAEQHASTLRTELSTAEQERDRIDAALAALTGSVKLPASGHTSNKSRKNFQSPSPKKADVIAAMRSVLQETTELGLGALREAVDARLSGNGFNRSGLAMRFKEACRDGQFVITPTGVRLAELESTTASTSKHVMETKSPARQSA